MAHQSRIHSVINELEWEVQVSVWIRWQGQTVKESVCDTSPLPSSPLHFPPIFFSLSSFLPSFLPCILLSFLPLPSLLFLPPSLLSLFLCFVRQGHYGAKGKWPWTSDLSVPISEVLRWPPCFTYWVLKLQLSQRNWATSTEQPQWYLSMTILDRRILFQCALQWRKIEKLSRGRAGIKGKKRWCQF